jgi:hypothetical protein
MSVAGALALSCNAAISATQASTSEAVKISRRSPW